METKDYLGPAVFAVCAVAAFITGIASGNKLVFAAGYIFIVMVQIAYLGAFVKTIKKDIEELKELLKKKN